jgi:hypothetical protein
VQAGKRQLNRGYAHWPTGLQVNRFLIRLRPNVNESGKNGDN